jgi:endogenous inhibitor of DNA gyrase (YacG/DUF329 family)
MSTQPPLVSCPRCDTEVEPVPILYGYPTPEAMQEVEAGRISLGGCMVGDESPEFECPACGGALPFAAEPHGTRRRRTVTPMDREGSA